MTLRACGSYDGSIRDLEFLRFFLFLNRFEVDAVYSSLDTRWPAASLTRPTASTRDGQRADGVPDEYALMAERYPFQS